MVSEGCPRSRFTPRRSWGGLRRPDGTDAPSQRERSPAAAGGSQQEVTGQKPGPRPRGLAVKGPTNCPVPVRLKPPRVTKRAPCRDAKGRPGSSPQPQPNVQGWEGTLRFTPPSPRSFRFVEHFNHSLLRTLLQRQCCSHSTPRTRPNSAR